MLMFTSLYTENASSVMGRHIWTSILIKNDWYKLVTENQLDVVQFCKYFVNILICRQLEIFQINSHHRLTMTQSDAHHLTTWPGWYMKVYASLTHLPMGDVIVISSNGNIFRVTGTLYGEFTGHRWIPLTKASDAELWCFLWFVSE